MEFERQFRLCIIFFTFFKIFKKHLKYNTKNFWRFICVCQKFERWRPFFFKFSNRDTIQTIASRFTKVLTNKDYW